jgi:hypothetical protein
MNKEIRIVNNYNIKDFPYVNFNKYNAILIIKPINNIQNGISILL